MISPNALDWLIRMWAREDVRPMVQPNQIALLTLFGYGSS